MTIGSVIICVILTFLFGGFGCYIAYALHHEADNTNGAILAVGITVIALAVTWIFPIWFYSSTEAGKRDMKTQDSNFNNGIVMTDTCIYNTDTTINREHAEDLKDYIHDVIDDGGVEHAYRLYQDLSDPDSDTTKIDPEEFNKFLDRVVFLLNSFGISSNRENVVALLAQTKDGSTLYDMMKDLIYPRMDEYVLLVNKSAGSEYENFMSDLVDAHQERLVPYINKLRERGCKVKDISSEDLHILLTVYFKALFEPVARGYSLEKAMKYLRIIDEFFGPGWMMLMGV